MTKGIITRFGETIDQYMTDRRASRKAGQQNHVSSTNRGRMVRWFLPNGGTVLLVVLLLWAQTAGALPLPAAQDTPNASTNTIAYQGRLADTSGTPITAFVNMAFRIYNVPTGGSPLWEEFWQGGNDVQVSDGLFNVMLGSLIPIPQSVVAGNNSLWLGIAAGNDDEMTPRVQLGSVPFAVRAAHVSSLNASDGDPANAVQVDSDGNMLVTVGRIGIGTTSPEATLHVNGNMKFNGQKFCSVVAPDSNASWRDSILVSSSWTNSTCAAFRTAIMSTARYQLGCIFEDSFSFGAHNGGIPSPNCGW